MTPTTPTRLAVSGIIMHQERLLLVNAWPAGKSDLMCAPGGGVERGSALTDNLVREVYEETGLHIAVDAPCLVNEFHDPSGSFHQVDVYFYCTLLSAPTLDHGWEDIDAIVTDRRWVTRAQMEELRVKPDSLAAVAWRDADAPMYDPLEPLIV